MPRFLLKRKSGFEIFIVMGFSSIFQQSSVSESKFFIQVVCVFSLQVNLVVLSRRFSSLIQWYSGVLRQKFSLKNWRPSSEHPRGAYCEEHEMKTWKFSVKTSKIANIIFEISTKFAIIKVCLVLVHVDQANFVFEESIERCSKINKNKTLKNQRNPALNG